MNEGELLSILLMASDLDGDNLSFTVSNPPLGSSFVDNGDGTASFSWMSDFGQAGNYPLSFTVTDNGLPATSDSEAITITVGDVNRSPLLSPISNQAVNAGELLSILLTDSDPDGDSWSFSMSGAPTGSSLIDNGDGTATFSWTPDFGQAANYPVSFTVVDNGLPVAIDSEAITISVSTVVINDFTITKAEWKDRQRILAVKGEGVKKESTCLLQMLTLEKCLEKQGLIKKGSGILKPGKFHRFLVRYVSNGMAISLKKE